MADWVTDATIGNETDRRAHDMPLDFPPFLDFQSASKFSSGWGKMNTGTFRRVEWRAAILPAVGHRPTSPFTVEVSNAAYYSWSPSTSWRKEFDVVLRPTGSGGYLGNPAGNGNPYEESRGNIAWQNVGNRYLALWNVDARMMHFWASKRHPFATGQTAELATMTVRLIDPPAETKLLAAVGVDYYNATENNTKTPGPGIGRYRLIPTDGAPLKCAWLTTPSGVVGTELGVRQQIEAMDDWISVNGLAVPSDPTEPPDPPPTEPPPDAGDIGQLRTELLGKIRRTRQRIDRQDVTLAQTQSDLARTQADYQHLLNRVATLEDQLRQVAFILRDTE